MKPVTTPATTDTYGAPRGSSDVGGLPYHRGTDDTMFPGHTIPVIYSEWELEAGDLEALQRGGRIQLAIYGEPIHPVSFVILEPDGADSSASNEEPEPAECQSTPASRYETVDLGNPDGREPPEVPA